MHPLRAILACSVVALAALAVSTASASEEGDAPAPRGPMPPPGYLDACVRLIQEGRHAEARARLEPIVADHPGWGRVHFYLGLAFHKEARYGEALPLFERATRLDPDYRPAIYYHGWCLYYLGELAAARERFEAFLRARPDYADAVFALGLIDFDRDDLESAGRRFERVIALAEAGNDTEVEAKGRARLADVLVRKGKLRPARVELERSLELAPHNHETWFKLSRVLQRLGEDEKAEEARRRHRETFEAARVER